MALHGDWVTQLTWVTDLALLLSASLDGTVALFDVRKVLPYLAPSYNSHLILTLSDLKRAALRVFDGHAKPLPVQVG